MFMNAGLGLLKPVTFVMVWSNVLQADGLFLVKVTDQKTEETDCGRPTPSSVCFHTESQGWVTQTEISYLCIFRLAAMHDVYLCIFYEMGSMFLITAVMWSK